MAGTTIDKFVRKFKEGSYYNPLHESLLTYLAINPVTGMKGVRYLVRYMHANLMLHDDKSCRYVQCVLYGSPLQRSFIQLAADMGYEVTEITFTSRSPVDGKPAKVADVDKGVPLQADWSWVTCHRGYCLFSPPMRAGGKRICPLKVVCGRVTPEMQSGLHKGLNLLPPFTWSVTKNNRIVLHDTKSFVKAVNSLMHRNEFEAVISTAYTLDWRDVHKTGSAYIFCPRFQWVSVEPFQISKADAPLLDPRQMLKFHDRLPAISYRVSPRLRVIGFDFAAFRRAVDVCMAAIELEAAARRGVNVSWLVDTVHTLDWRHVTYRNGHYIFQPQLEGIMFRPVSIKFGDGPTSISRMLADYAETMPVVHYRVNEYLQVVGLDKAKFVSVLTQYRDSIRTKAAEKEKHRLNKIKQRLGDKGVDSGIFTTAFVLDWTDVRFYNRYFIFTPQLGAKTGKLKIAPLRVDDYRCRPSFNYILGYFRQRLPQITYHITHGGKVQLDSSPLFEAALVYLKQEQERMDIAASVGSSTTGVPLGVRCGLQAALSRAAAMKPGEFQKYKSRFIDYLVTQQMEEYNIVPVIENVTHRRGSFDEASFIFTVRSWDERLFIIIENVNPDRATLLFKVKPDMYMTALQAIYDYIQSEIINKRSAIRSGDISFDTAGVVAYWTFIHDTYTDWMYRLQAHFG